MINKRERRRAHLASSHNDIVAVNPGDQDWTRHKYLVEHGSGYSSWFWLVWANDEASAIDEVADWCEDNAPGFFADEEYKEKMDELIAEWSESHGGRIPNWEDNNDLMSDFDQEASSDLMSVGDGSHYMQSYSWHISRDPTREALLDIQRRMPRHFAQSDAEFNRRYPKRR